MAITRSTAADRTQRQLNQHPAPVFIPVNLVLSLIVSLLFGYGAWKVKAVQEVEYNFTDVSATLKEQEKIKPQRQTPVNLNAVTSSKEILPILDFLESDKDREFAAGIIYEYTRNNRLANVGQLAKVRYRENDLPPDAPEFRRRFDEAKKAADEAKLKRDEAAKQPKPVKWYIRLLEILGIVSPRAEEVAPPEPEVSVRLLSDISRIKDDVVVRAPWQFISGYWQMIGLYLVSMYVTQLFWWWKKGNSDVWLFPILHTLTGLGLLMSVSLKDPLRDRMEFEGFALGIVAGCIGIIAVSFIDLDKFRRSKTASWGWLAVAIGLSAALLLFGQGPEGSPDVKVNLLGFQPVEAIKIALVFFLAGIFGRNWEKLRELQHRTSLLPRALRAVNIPRIQDSLPVMAGVGVAMVFFFFQKDLGPALIVSCTFLTLYAVARGRSVLSIFGLAVIVLGFWGGYKLGSPPTVVDRVNMMLSPFDNYVRGGEQVAHALWAFSTGGLTGSGVGYGDARVIPAGYTDLIISVVGEQLGFAGILIVYGLYAVLLWRGIRIALTAAEKYDFFLALGLTLLTAYQIILISGGILGLIPLSGVVSPFLSHGKSSMLANCVIVGLLLLISSRTGKPEDTEPFHRQAGVVTLVLGMALLVIVGKAASVQVINADEIMIAGALVVRSEPYSADELADYKAEVYKHELAAARKKAGLPDTSATDEDDAGDKKNEDFEAKFKDDFLRKYGFGSRGRPYAKRDYVYNPRLTSIAQLVPRGAIYDRNGIPLATSNWEEIERNRKKYQELGVAVDHVCQRSDLRHYPFGDLLFHLLGNWRTRTNWAAANTDYIEKDYNDRLQGYSSYPERIRRYDSRIEAHVPITRQDFHDLIGVLHHRHQPDHPAMKEFLNRKRDVRMSIDIGLQQKVAVILREAIAKDQKLKRGSVVVMSPETGELLASVGYPWPGELKPIQTPKNASEKRREEIRAENLKNLGAMLIDRARFGTFPPGSTFKLVTAMAAMPNDEKAVFQCVPLGDGRVGFKIPGWGDPTRDDIGDKSAHGSVNLERGMVVSCNAYFAQLGVRIGAPRLFDTMSKFNISAGNPNTAEELGKTLPQSAYGQGEITASPFQMAKVASTVANHGKMPFGKWVIDESNQRTDEPREIVPMASAQLLARALRGVVTEGTGKVLANSSILIAGKTGTAEAGRGRKSHSWFVGFAPFGEPPARQIAFSVLIENSGYGSKYAAPVAKQVVEVARERQYISQE
ncbi:MAG: FtsW/RodA/SpoVE family cell cycle protein [Acidobacteria bacterium]|nr:FtsW/RodA/SpoVE family cell cycle protein [Acidobacteriota bacterium]